MGTHLKDGDICISCKNLENFPNKCGDCNNLKPTCAICGLPSDTDPCDECRGHLKIMEVKETK